MSFNQAKQTRDTVITVAAAFAIAALLIAAGCPLSSSSGDQEHKRLKDSSSDASAAILVPQACNTLRALNCAAGNPSGTTCEAVLGKIAADRLTPLADNLACVIKATTKEAVRGCGPVECP